MDIGNVLYLKCGRLKTAPFWSRNAKHRSVSQVEGFLGQFTFKKKHHKPKIKKTNNTGIKNRILC